MFGEDDGDLKNTDYWKVLNVEDNGVMGYLSIPKINIKLAIYHGTGDDVLQTGVGHLNGTKLPIGGESNHAVLAAHRGLPSARLFTDIDQMEAGDKFYIHVLDEVLAYQVDQILPMVDKDDHETLQNALKIEDGKDQVTLFTCTPYGVNSHRLLVRGSNRFRSRHYAARDPELLYVISASRNCDHGSDHCDHESRIRKKTTQYIEERH